MPEPDRDDNETFVPSVGLIPGGRVDGSIRPPGSKSLTNRALVCAAFADGTSTLSGALASEDTKVMIEALRAVGVDVELSDGGRTLVVDSGKRESTRPGDGPAQLFMANSGTSIRFLTAALSAAGGKYRLYGIERMHQRPIGDLVAAIDSVLDGTIEATSSGDCPPVIVDSRGWKGRAIKVAGSVSSQYLSGLMMAAPIATAESEVMIEVTPPLVSKPYVEMTAKVMRSFGAGVSLSEDGLVVEIAPTRYRSVDYRIEPDASAASYFWGAAAITGGSITVVGLTRDAIQGDVGFCEVLGQMGCRVDYGVDAITVDGGILRGVDVDMNSISDTVQTLAVVALFADGPTRVRGVAHNRFKETDRIGDLARELRKLGATVEEHADGMTIIPPEEKSRLHGARIETYNDHRMAMSLALAGLRIEGVWILNPSCTAKTYPEYFADLERLIGRAHHWSNE